jgi:polysaccharide biosynthesis transport protein
MSTSEEPARDLAGYLAIVRRRLWLAALVVLVAVGAAGAYTFHQPILYRAKMKIVVGVNGGVLPLDVGNVADQFSQTMSDLLASDIVAARAVAQAKADGVQIADTPQQVLERLHVTTKPETAVLQVAFDDTDPGRAVDVLSAVGRVFTQLVDERLATSEKSNLTVSVSVFNPAHATGKVQPKPLRNLAVAGVLGLLLGLLAALMREQFDDTIRTAEQAEQAFGQTATTTLAPGIVGYRPFDRLQAKRADPVLTELALQRLRASIIWSPDSLEARTLLVTSANPEEGKTTLSANLAVVMATEGRDVIVIDADLRHPSLYRYLGMPVPSDTTALDSVMRGDVSAAGALVEIPVPAQAFSANTDREIGSWIHIRPEPAASGRLRAILAPPGRAQHSEYGLARTLEIISELRSMADFVIVDAPPILVVPDAYPFAVAVDTVVAVVRNGSASGRATAAFSRTLERLRAKRVELVVTEAEPSFAQAYYYGHSGESASTGGRHRRTGSPTSAPTPIPVRLNGNLPSPPSGGARAAASLPRSISGLGSEVADPWQAGSA